MNSIRSKITLLTMSAIIIVVTIVAVIAAVSIRKLGDRNADQVLYLMCETGQKNLNAYFDGAEQSVKTISELTEEDLKQVENEKQLADHLERMRTAFEKVMHQTNGVLTYYYRIDPEISKKNKGFWYTNLDGEGFKEEEMTDITLYDTNDTSELVWFTVPKATGKPIWLSPYVTESIDVRVISYNIPIYWKSEFIGVIGTEIDYSLMSAEVDNITLYEHGYAFITDMDGNLIYHPHIDAAILTDMSKPDVPEQLRTENRYFRYSIEGEEKLGVWLPLDNGMRLNVSVPVSEINSIWKETVGTILVVLLFLLIVVGFLCRRFSLELTQPLEDLTKATEQLNRGDYNIELNYSGKDEVGILTHTFSHLVHNLQDEIHALAESEQANKAKTSFLSNMSHEIRTPITTVLGMNEIISRETSDKSILVYCDNIRKAGKNLLGIINDILDFSKIESGKMELIPAPYSLRELIGDLYNMIQIRAEEKGLHLVLDIDPHLPSGLVGDVLRIKQVITNLLTNAVKYTEAGTVTLTVSLEDQTDETATIHVAVSDTGIGIREEEMDKLFETFDRLDTRRTYTIEGTGLGLAISRRLLRMMKSDMCVESTYNEGSTFSFDLQQEISDPAEIDRFDVQSARLNEYTRLESFSFVAPGSHILLVDDTLMNLEVIKGLLKPTQLEVDVARSGTECIAKFTAYPYDLVFLDYRMPHMNGIETLKKLKEKEPERTAATPIISLTANAVLGERERMIDAGFTDYLTKPVNISDMDAILVKYLPEEAVIPVSDHDNDQIEQELYKGIPQSAFNCSWLDPKEGVEYCGSGFMYMKAVELYVNMAEEKAKLIEKCVSEGDIELYTITLHALKSSSRSIGMESFSLRARDLELAGKAQDIDTIKRDTPDFLKAYRTIQRDLEKILAETTNE